MRSLVLTAALALFLGSLPGAAGGMDLRAAARDDSRSESWTERWDSGIDESEVGGYPPEEVKDSVTSPDGRYLFVTGIYMKGYMGQADAFTLAYETETGTLVWEHRYAGTLPESGNGGQAIAISPDGERLYVSGFADGVVPGFPGLAVMAYDATNGDLLWAESAEGTYSAALDVVVAENGREIYVTGSHYPEEGVPPDVVIAGFDADDGDELWRELYDGNGGFDRGWQIETGNDRLFVLAQVQRKVRGPTDVHVLAYDVDGNRPDLAWDGAAILDGTVEPQQMDISPNGSVYVTAPQHENDMGVPKMSRVVRLDRHTGDIQWSMVDRRIISDTLTVDSKESAIYVMGGDSPLDNRSHPPAALAFDARTGESRWQAKIPASYDTYFTDADLDERSGTFYATGNALVGGLADMFTVAFDTNDGEVEWVARFNADSGGSVTSGATLSLGPDGSAYSAGIGSATDTPEGYTPTFEWTDVFVVAYLGDGTIVETPTPTESETPEPEATETPFPDQTVSPFPTPYQSESPQPEATESPSPEPYESGPPPPEEPSPSPEDEMPPPEPEPSPT